MKIYNNNICRTTDKYGKIFEFENDLNLTKIIQEQINKFEWKTNGKWQMLITDKFKFTIMPSYSQGSQKIHSWTISIKDLNDFVKGFKDGFKTPNEAKKWIEENY